MLTSSIQTLKAHYFAKTSFSVDGSAFFLSLPPFVGFDCRTAVPNWMSASDVIELATIGWKLPYRLRRWFDQWWRLTSWLLSPFPHWNCPLGHVATVQYTSVYYVYSIRMISWWHLGNWLSMMFSHLHSVLDTWLLGKACAHLQNGINFHYCLCTATFLFRIKKDLKSTNLSYGLKNSNGDGHGNCAR